MTGINIPKRVRQRTAEDGGPDDPIRKEWKHPELRKLAISATAESTKGGDLTANDGDGAGKGDLLFQS